MDGVSFSLNGELVQAHGAEQLRLSASEFIRRFAGCTSVKVSCGEGGCGACAVELVEHDATTGDLRALAVNSCLLPVAALDGRHVLTSEGLGNSREGFSPVQARLAGFHGTQCGFCSPGVVVSTHAALMAAAAAAGHKAPAAARGAACGAADASPDAADGPRRQVAADNSGGCGGCGAACAGSGGSCQQRGGGGGAAPTAAAAAAWPPSAAQLLGALDGNLCRCTGWRPIADMAKSFSCAADIEDLGLSSLRSEDLGPVAPQQLLPVALRRRLPHLGLGPPAERGQQQQQQQRTFDAALQAIGPGSVLAPASVAQLLEALRAARDAGVPAHLLGGNTGAGVFPEQWQSVGAKAVVLLGRVRELQGLAVERKRGGEGGGGGRGAVLVAGAAVTISRLQQALQDAAEREAAAAAAATSSGDGADDAAAGARSLRFMAAHISRIAGTLVRNAATLGGHLALVAARALESDLMPMLLATGAEVQLTALDGSSRWVPAEELAACGGGGGGDGGSSSADGGAPDALAADVAQQLAGGTAFVSALRLPLPVGAGVRLWSHKLTAHRHGNEHAAVNMAAWLSAPAPGGAGGRGHQLRVAVGTYQQLGEARGSSGCGAGQSPEVAWRCGRAARVEEAVLAALGDGGGGGRALLQALGRLPQLLLEDLRPAGRLGEFARSAAPGLLLKGLAAVLPHSQLFSKLQQQQQQQQDGLGRPQAAASPEQPPPPPLLPVTPALLRELEAAAAAPLAPAPPPRGAQDLPVDLEADPPLYWPAEKDGAKLQASGEAQYTDDVPVAAGALYAAYATSTKAHARLAGVDWSAALEVPGVVGFVGPDDVPAGPDAQISSRVVAGPPEPLFAHGEVQYAGQPLGLVLAKTLSAARAGAARVRGVYEPVGAPEAGAGAGPLTTLEAAVAAGSWYDLAHVPSMKAHKGDVEAALSSSARVLAGRVELGSQRHLYMEPQTAVATPEEGGRLSVVSSCQGCDQVLWAVARALGMRHNQVHVSCRRVGGGFGGKADRAIFPAAAAAVAAHKMRKQVRLVVAARVDGSMNAGRCPMEVEWTAGVDSGGRLQALKLDFTCTAGAFFGSGIVETGSIAQGADNVYDIPAFSVSVRVARCHLPPRTTVRGPGKVSAVIALEAVLQQLACELGQSADELRERLMLRWPEEALAAAAAAAAAADAGRPDTGASNGAACAPASAPGAGAALPHPRFLPEGAPMLRTTLGKAIELRQYTLPAMWRQLRARCRYEARRQAVAAFNKGTSLRKRGLAMVPIRYQMFHQHRVAGATIYADGSVLVTHPGTEMGQGIATKAAQAAAAALGQLLPPGERGRLLQHVRVACGSTELLPHSGVAAASTTSEAAAAAITAACETLVERLRPAARRLSGDGAAAPTWEEIVRAVAPPDPVMASQVVLTATARSALTDAQGFFDPAAIYHTFGCGAAEVEVDLLTGERRLLRADLAFDAGRSTNPAVDLGQVEGAFMQGVGHLMSEEVVEDEATGATLSCSTWTYKPPGIADLPQELNVFMLRDSPVHIHKMRQLSAKATGEPPFMLAAAVACALQDAIAAAWADQPQQRRKGAGPAQPALRLPATAANVKAALPPLLLLEASGA